MEPLDEYVAECKNLNKDAFVRQHRHPWLLLPAIGEDTGDKFRNFRTTNVNARALARSGEVPEAANAYQVLRVVKSIDNPWRNRISLGRARNNDLVLRDRSISKLHAHFNFSDDGRASLTDAGSRNGTEVNGERIQGQDAIVLVAGDQLRLGRVDAVFHDSPSFFDFLRSLLGS